MGDPLVDGARNHIAPVPSPTGWDDAAGLAGLLIRAPGVIGATGMVSATGAAGLGLTAAAIVAPFVAAFLGMYAVGRATERRDELGKYNAFLQAFAQAVSDFAHGNDRRRRSFVYQDSSIRGRNAAIFVLTDIGPEKRREVLDRYRGITDREAVQTIVDRLGGYRTLGDATFS